VVVAKRLEAQAAGVDDVRVPGVGLNAVASPVGMADIAIGQREAGFAVVVLLIDHAVEADVAALQLRHRRLPDVESEATAAMIRMHDVETDEAETRAVAHG